MAGFPDVITIKLETDVGPIERLTLKPGDRLVLSLRDPITDADYDRLQGEIAMWGLPEDVKVIILDAGAELRVLSREADGS